MKRNKEIPLSRQTLIWSTGLTLQFFAQWLISVLLVRMSGYETAGVFALAMTISNIFAYFANYGIRGYQVTNRNSSYSDGDYLCVRAFTVLSSIVACLFYLYAVPNYTPTEAAAIILYLGYNSINTISDVMQGSMQCRNHLEIGGYSNSLRGLCCLVTFLAGFQLSNSLIVALTFMIFGTLIITLLYDFPNFLGIISGDRYSMQFHCKSSIKLLCICFPLMLSQTIPILTTAIPRRTIQSFYGAEMLGVYSSIFAPAAIILTLIPSIVTAILPRITEDWNIRGSKEFYKWIWVGAISVPLLCTAGGVGVLVLGKAVLRLLFGDNILSYMTLFYWAVFVAVFSGIVAYYNGLLIVVGQLKAIGILTFIALAITAMSTGLIVRRYGIYGAAYIQILTYSVQMILQILIVIWAVGRGGKQ